MASDDKDYELGGMNANGRNVFKGPLHVGEDVSSDHDRKAIPDPSTDSSGHKLTEDRPKGDELQRLGKRQVLRVRRATRSSVREYRGFLQES
jgi:hypothetical protein